MAAAACSSETAAAAAAHPEALIARQAAIHFVRNITVSAMDGRAASAGERRGCASTENLHQSSSGFHASASASSPPPSRSLPTSPGCSPNFNESGRIFSTPSTEVGLTPTPGPCSHPSTSHSLCRGAEVTPSSRAARAADTSSPGGFVPSPPRTAPGGVRRLPFQRGSSFPSATPTAHESSSSFPERSYAARRAEEEQREFQCAKLSARNFISSIVLQKVLAGALLPKTAPKVETAEQTVASGGFGESPAMVDHGPGGRADPLPKEHREQPVAADEKEHVVAEKPSDRASPKRAASTESVSSKAKSAPSINRSISRSSRGSGRNEEKQNLEKRSNLSQTKSTALRGGTQCGSIRPRSSKSGSVRRDADAEPTERCNSSSRSRNHKSTVDPSTSPDADGAVAVKDAGGRTSPGTAASTPASRQARKRAGSSTSTGSGASRKAKHGPKASAQSRDDAAPISSREPEKQSPVEDTAAQALDLHGGSFGLLAPDTCETPDIEMQELASGDHDDVPSSEKADEDGAIGDGQGEYAEYVDVSDGMPQEYLPSGQYGWTQAHEATGLQADSHPAGGVYYYSASQVYQTQSVNAFAEWDAGVGLEVASHEHYYGTSAGVPFGTALDATITGEQLGQLLAGSCFPGMFGAPVSISLNDQAAAAIYGAAGMHCTPVDAHTGQYAVDSEAYTMQPAQRAYSFQQFQHQQYAAYQQRYDGTGDTAMDAEDEAASEAGEQTPLPERRLRETPRKAFREEAGQDLLVVKAKGGIKGEDGLPSQSQDGGLDAPQTMPTPSRRSIQSVHMVDEDNSQTDGAAVDKRSHGADPSSCSATGLQVRSVRLLEDLEMMRSTGTALPPAQRHKRASRPNSVVGHFDAVTPSTFSRCGTPSGQSHASASRPSTGEKARPRWNNTFTNVHERRIPRYDSLIDEHCPVMTSPARLKQLMETRELSSEYLHIVRSRFETYRRLFDPDCKLGDRCRPEQAVPIQSKSSPSRPPATLLSRVLEMHKGVCNAGGGWEHDDLTASITPPNANAQDTMFVSPSLACSIEWHGSPLYCQCLRERNGEDDGSLPTLAEPGANVGPPGDTLPERWERLRMKIEMLWHELSVPADICMAMRQGPLAAVTAGSVYQLEMHQQELLEFREHTKQIIHDCLARDEVLDNVLDAYALGISDGRLQLLREDLVALDKLGTHLVHTIGVWARKYGQFIVDVEKSPSCRHEGIRPRAIFVWIGRDAVDRIQKECEALSSGDIIGPRETNEQGSNGGLPAVGRPGSASRKAKPDGLTPPLVSKARVSHKFAIADVLHQGPPPCWYQPHVAKAGIAAIRRGIPCGGGDKRV